MKETSNSVKKQTLYICIAASLLVGFLGGVMYSAFQTPAPGINNAAEHNHDDQQAVIASLVKRTQDQPDDSEAWTQLGHAYFDSDQFANAIEAYQKSLAIQPGNTNVMTDLGVMYRRNGQSDKSLATFDKVLKMEPGHEQARFNKGVVLLNDFNDKPGAIAQWKRITQINPEAKAPSGALLSDIITQIENSK